MPKEALFEDFSELEYRRLVRDRPYVTQLYIPKTNQVNYKPFIDRVNNNKQLPFTEEEKLLADSLKRNILRQQELYLRKIYGNVRPFPKLEHLLIDKGLPERVLNNGMLYTGDVPFFSHPFIPANSEQKKYFNVELEDKKTYLDVYNKHNARWRAGEIGRYHTQLLKESKDFYDQINSGVRNVNAYQAEKAKKEAAAAAAQAKAQAEKDQRIVQLEAQKASYEKDIAFKKTEFEKALAAQKASSESVRKQMLADFEAQKNNIRTETERLHQEMLAQHTAELQKQRGRYESQLSASAAELQKQKIMFEDQLTARTIELERQRASYEAQLAARAAEEAKRKQDAEAFQSQLRRKLNIYERGRVGFNFVGTNTPNTQIKGTKIGATKGGRYVAGRIRYDKNGMAVYDTNEGTPDLFLQMIGIAKKMRK